MKKRPPTLHKDMQKTKICPYADKGCCPRERCSFAHSQEELKTIPDFRLTKLCPSVIRNKKCLNVNCSYAHCWEELKLQESVAENMKMRLCIFWPKGTCKNEDKCRFAHGVSDLRVPPNRVATSESRRNNNFMDDEKVLLSNRSEETRSTTCDNTTRFVSVTTNCSCDSSTEYSSSRDCFVHDIINVDRIDVVAAVGDGEMMLNEEVVRKEFAGKTATYAADFQSDLEITGGSHYNIEKNGDSLKIDADNIQKQQSQSSIISNGSSNKQNQRYYSLNAAAAAGRRHISDSVLLQETTAKKNNKTEEDDDYSQQKIVVMTKTDQVATPKTNFQMENINNNAMSTKKQSSSGGGGGVHRNFTTAVTSVDNKNNTKSGQLQHHYYCRQLLTDNHSDRNEFEITLERTAPAAETDDISNFPALSYDNNNNGTTTKVGYRAMKGAVLPSKSTAAFAVDENCYYSNREKRNSSSSVMVPRQNNYSSTSHRKGGSGAAVVTSQKNSSSAICSDRHKSAEYCVVSAADDEMRANNAQQRHFAAAFSKCRMSGSGGEFLSDGIKLPVSSSWSAAYQPQQPSTATSTPPSLHSSNNNSSVILLEPRQNVMSSTAATYEVAPPPPHAYNAAANRYCMVGPAVSERRQQQQFTPYYMNADERLVEPGELQLCSTVAHLPGRFNSDKGAVYHHPPQSAAAFPHIYITTPVNSFKYSSKGGCSNNGCFYEINNSYSPANAAAFRNNNYVDDNNNFVVSNNNNVVGVNEERRLLPQRIINISGSNSNISNSYPQVQQAPPHGKIVQIQRFLEPPIQSAANTANNSSNQHPPRHITRLNLVYSHQPIPLTAYDYSGADSLTFVALPNFNDIPPNSPYVAATADGYNVHGPVTTTAAVVI